VLFNQPLIWIDFGQSQISSLVEDKAVDLALFEKCLISTHSKVSEVILQAVFEAYGEGKETAVLKRLEKGFVSLIFSKIERKKTVSVRLAGGRVQKKCQKLI
jgi:tRNA A-37 threonylcarbamoyl transferase component Bud32